MSDWLTYTEAASRFGVSAEAVRQIALRRKWPRRRPNDDPFGRVQVLIPDDAEIGRRTGVQHPDEHPSNTRSTGEIDTLRDALEREQERADRAEKRADEAVMRADAADADRRAAQARADAAEGRADQAEADRRAADTRTEAERARADRSDAAAVAERARADALRQRTDELQAGQQLMMDMHARALAEAQEQLERVREAADGMRQAEQERRARGLLARLRAAMRRE